MNYGFSTLLVGVTPKQLLESGADVVLVRGSETRCSEATAHVNPSDPASDVALWLSVLEGHNKPIPFVFFSGGQVSLATDVEDALMLAAHCTPAHLEPKAQPAHVTRRPSLLWWQMARAPATSRPR